MNKLVIISVILIAFLVYSGINPYDRATWLLEVLPVIIALPILWFTYRSFPLTTLLYICIFIHVIVLIIGGTYTYARVPIGFSIAGFFDLDRNPYDKIGHFFQGFVPALIAREILVRLAVVKGRKMLVFITLCIVLAISAFYELIEWWVAVAAGQDAEAFLGTQGYQWDTQSDMFIALIGAIMALLLFSRIQDQQISKIQSNSDL